MVSSGAARIPAVLSRVTVVRASLFVVVAFAVTMAVSGNAWAAGFDLVMAAVTIAIGRIMVSRTDPGFARRLLFAALALHWLAVGALQLVLLARGHPPLLSEDEFGYDRIAVELSRFWLGTGPAVPSGDVYLEGPFAALLAAAYTVGGYTPLAGLAIPVAFGTWLPVLTHRLMSDYLNPFGRRAARIAGLIALLYPVTLGWSCVLLRDSSETFAGTAVVVGVLALMAGTGSLRHRAVDFGLGIFGIAWLSTNRAIQLVPVAVGGILVAARWTLRQPMRMRVAVLIATGCAAVAILFASPIRHRIDRVPHTLAVRRETGAKNGFTGLRSRLGEAPEGPPSRATWMSTAGHIPAGLALALLRPYPTQAQNAAEVAGVAGNVLYLIFCVVAAVGVAGAWRTGRRDETLLLAGTIVGWWLILSIAEGNAGTAWRHRDAVTPLLACFAGIALARSPRAARLADPVRRRMLGWRNRSHDPMTARRGDTA